MKNFALILLLIVTLTTMLVIGGCSKKSPGEPDEETELTELDKSYGGYDTSDEIPAFGDVEISTNYQDDSDAGDPVIAEPGFNAAIESNAVNAYFIRIVWGMLEFDSTATNIIDWNGSASINRGTLGIMKKIRFEGNDQINYPRPDRKTVTWNSYTTVHSDGISFVIIDNDTSDTEGLFTFSTGQYNITLTYDELDSLEILETVTGEDHQVSIHAYSKQVIPFGGGFLEGRWVRVDERGGKFHGKWINRIGSRVGYLRGIWGINANGDQVLHGKYISLNGRFGGLLTGHWGNNDEDDHSGWFSGRWVNRSLANIGVFRGHWKTKVDNPEYGYFQGKWKATN